MNSLESNPSELVSKTKSPSEEYFQMEASEMSSNYMQTESAVKNDNISNGVPFSGTIAVAPDSPPGLSIGAGITLMQSSPPPASYRHSRAYRHFKNPPQPHMCIRTTSESGEELFINVLSWTRIVIPQEPSDPIPLYGGMRVPPGSPRSPPIVFAVMANPEVLKDSGRHSKDAEERRAMVELMCDFVEAMNPGVKLVRNAVILKDRDISGELKDVWNAVQAQRDREREEQLLQQRQQQQYITTQQMFPKTGQHASATQLPTPSPMLIGGRCGSLVGSGNEIASTEAHQNATSEENSATTSNYETSAGEESETTHFVTTTSALSAITDACPNTSTAAGTSDNVSTATTTTTTTTAATTTTTTTISTTNNDDDECATLSNQMNKIEYEKDQIAVEKIEKEEDEDEEENMKQKTTTTTTMVNVECGKDHVDSVTNQQNNSKYKNNNINLNNNNNNSTNNNIKNNDNNNKNKLNNKSNNQLLPTMANNMNENILKFCNKTADMNTTTTITIQTPATPATTTTLLPTTKLQQMEATTPITPITTNADNINKIIATTTTTIATTKTTENTAINALSNNNSTTTTTTATTTTKPTPTPASTTTTTTTPTTLLTKREKLGGFLPNGCIFPRFKNNKKDKEKDKDKDKDKEKETKCKDKEKTLLYALKKSKDKKMANSNVDKKSQANKQDKVSTSAPQQQQQQLVDTKAQYDKNCINLENEMQKLEINNKINNETTTNNSEKNMFNKLKCATSSAAAK